MSVEIENEIKEVAKDKEVEDLNTVYRAIPIYVDNKLNNARENWFKRLPYYMCCEKR